jgi:L-threonylcarbamoyladenylate synthase
MKTVVLRAESPASLERALEVLRLGGLVAFPTDTVYGVGALAFDSQAVERVYWAKQRAVEKAIPILLGQKADLETIASSVPEMARRLASRFWPGPLTLVVLKKGSLPQAVASGATVGARVPDHHIALALLRLAGAMAVTSANLSGGESARTASEVMQQLSGKVELVLDGGRIEGGIASTVVDCTQPEPRILRPGPVSLEDISAALA